MSILESAKAVSQWSMRDVLDYLGRYCADVVEYPPDVDTDTAAVIDRENRARAVVYRAGESFNRTTLDRAGRALEVVA